MALKNKSFIKIFLVIFAVLLCCFILSLHLNVLLENYTAKQVQHRSTLVSNFITSNISNKFENLTAIASQLESDGDHISVILNINRERDLENQLGLISTSGEIFLQNNLDAVSKDDFSCIMDSFRGKPSICYSGNKKLMLSVPVFNKRNVRYVLYKIYNNKTPFIQNDCIHDKCYMAILSKNGDVIEGEKLTEWFKINSLKNLNHKLIFEELLSNLTSNISIIHKKIEGETYYFYLADLKPYDLFFTGMLASDVIADEVHDISLLFFIMVTGIAFLIFIILGIYLFSNEKRKTPINLLQNGYNSKTNSYVKLVERIGLELRNPAVSILGINAILLKEIEKPTLKDCSLQIQNSGRTLANLASDILDIAKADSQTIEMANQEYDFFNVLADSYYSIFGTNKSQKINLQVDAYLPINLMGDEIRVKQIIQNIFSYTKSILTDDSLEVRVYQKYTEIDSIKGELHSTYIVIEFPKGQSEWNSIGANLAKRLILLLNGFFNDENLLGDSPAYTISIPQQILNPDKMGDFNKRYNNYLNSKEHENKVFRAPGATILAVDEVPMNLRVLNGYLKEFQIQLDIISNGIEALEKFKTKHYDIVLLDHTMPIIGDMDLLTLMKESNSINHNVPIIMLASQNDSVACEVYSQMGYKDVLTKPIFEENLVAILEKYLPQNLLEYFNNEEDKTIPATNVTLKKPATPSVIKQDFSDESLDSLRLSDDLKKLFAKGIDVFLGLKCCENNEALYRKKLMNYCEENQEEPLSKLIKDENFENYRLKISSLKSISLSIGAIEVASYAKLLEHSCDEGKYDYTQKLHQKLILKYKEVLQNLKEIL